MPRRPKGAADELLRVPRRRSANVAQPTQQLIDATAVRWWRWRHCYLQGMQIALDERIRAAQGGRPEAAFGTADDAAMPPTT